MCGDVIRRCYMCGVVMWVGYKGDVDCVYQWLRVGVPRCTSVCNMANNSRTQRLGDVGGRIEATRAMA